MTWSDKLQVVKLATSGLYFWQLQLQFDLLLKFNSISFSSQHTTADDLDTDHSLTSFNVTINISTEITNCPIDLKKSVEIYVDEWDTVGNLKTYISLVTGIPFERQRLVYPQSKEPEDNRTLASCGIKSDAEIELIVGRLKGGNFKQSQLKQLLFRCHQRWNII